MDRLIRALVGGAGLAAILGLLHGEAQGAPPGTAPPQIVARLLQSPPITPNLFGTTALRISAKRFWSEWERARRDASASPELRQLIAPARALSRRQQIAFVQSAVDHRIKWRSDATEWGRHDYWASAAETLRHGYGDMEDRAIVKMQALRALGVPTNDLYLTLGRDRVSGPQTVLIVRDGRTYYVLDDTGGTPYTPERRPEFQPVLTFGYGASWVHSGPMAKTRIAGGGSSARSTAF